MMVVADKERNQFNLSGNGDVLEPKDGIMAIVQEETMPKPARALYKSKLSAEDIAKRSLEK